MNRKLFTLLVIWIVSLSGAWASGIMSGEITYRYKGNSKFDVYVKVVRDCNGAAMSQAPVVARCSTATITINQQTKIGVVDITPIGDRCPVTSKCASGSTYLYGFEEHTWKMELDLSSYANTAFCDWDLSWELCCRNGNITTGLANQNFFLTATLNTCFTTPNSSVVYTNPPTILLCQGQDFAYNMGAKDTVDTGDSLSFHLVAPLAARNTSVQYTGNFSPTRPLTFFGFPNTNLSWPAGFRLDPVTGDLLFRPTTANQIAVIAIETKEWRLINGVRAIVGTTRRDFMVMIPSCPNNSIPRISPPYSAQFCSGVQNCMSITTDDDDQDDTVSIFLTGTIPGATFTHNNGQARLASGQICWTPHDSNVSNIPYTVYITAKDNACNMNGQSVRAFSMFVRQSPKAELSSTWLSCGDVAYTMNPLNTLPGFNYHYNLRDSNWNVLETRYAQTDTIQVPPGRHYLELRLSTSTPCPISIVDTLDIPNYIQVQLPSDTTVCYGDTLNLTAGLGGGPMPYTGTWLDAITNQNLNISSPNWSARVTDTLNLRYRASDSLGCVHSDSIAVKFRALPKVNLGVDQAYCTGDSLRLDRGVDTLHLLYQWSSGDTGQYLWVAQEGDIWLRASDTFGCRNSDTLLVHENAPHFEMAMDSAACVGSTIQYTESKLDSIWYYELTPSPVLISTSLSRNFPVLQTKDYRAIANRTLLGRTCSISQDFTLTAWDLPVFSLPSDFTLCDGDSSLLAVSLASAAAYEWSDNVMANQRWVSDSGTYVLNITDTLGCRFSDSIAVSVNPFQLQSSGDQIACLGDSIYFSASGADSLLWYDEASYVPGASLPVNRGTQWEYELLQENNWLLAGYKTAHGLTCVQWDTLAAEAYPQVNVSSINGNFNPVDTVSSYTYSVNSTGLSVFFWTVDQGTILSGQGTSSVEVQWNRTDSAQIRIQAWTADGCESETDATIRITLTSVSALLNQRVQVFPNPFTGQLTIRLANWHEPVELELLNQVGQVIDRIDLRQAELTLDWTRLSNGVYFIRVKGSPDQGRRVVKY